MHGHQFLPSVSFIFIVIIFGDKEIGLYPIHYCPKVRIQGLKPKQRWPKSLRSCTRWPCDKDLAGDCVFKHANPRIVLQSVALVRQMLKSVCYLNSIVSDASGEDRIIMTRMPKLSTRQDEGNAYEQAWWCISKFCVISLSYSQLSLSSTRSLVPNCIATKSQPWQVLQLSPPVMSYFQLDLACTH